MLSCVTKSNTSAWAWGHWRSEFSQAELAQETNHTLSYYSPNLNRPNLNACNAKIASARKTVFSFTISLLA